MTFQELQDKHAIWAQKNFPDTEAYQALLGIVEEVGELSHAHLKAEQGIRGTADEHHAAKVDAIGDILVYMAHYCTKSGINLDEAITKTWNCVEQRDWTKNKFDGTIEA